MSELFDIEQIKAKLRRLFDAQSLSQLFLDSHIDPLLGFDSLTEDNLKLIIRSLFEDKYIKLMRDSKAIIYLSQELTRDCLKGGEYQVDLDGEINKKTIINNSTFPLILVSNNQIFDKDSFLKEIDKITDISTTQNKDKKETLQYIYNKYTNTSDPKSNNSLLAWANFITSLVIE